MASKFLNLTYKNTTVIIRKENVDAVYIETTHGSHITKVQYNADKQVFCDNDVDDVLAQLNDDDDGDGDML